MNDYNYLKINYRYAIHLILMFINFGLLSTLILIFSSKIIPSLKSGPLLQIVGYTLPFLFLFWYIYLKNRKESVQWNTPWKTLGWNIYVSAFCLTIFTIVLNEYIINIIPKEGPLLGPLYSWFDTNMKEQLVHPVTFFIAAVLLAPFCEEFFFRGILLNGLLRENISPVKAILFSSFLFGVIHMNPWQFIGAFSLGNLIGLIYFRTHSLLLCILLHALNNGLIVFLTFIDKEEKISQWIQSHTFIGWVALIPLAVVLRLFLFQTRLSWNQWSLSRAVPID
ncbi:CPBP family glutamic-type intramembrane protease [Bacteroidetes bacterium endosymbiont of Geopemphigus sp.]|uniref:CPBP family glutamic-type intramembrane protease n=1 Tax=Bacteroidetes bacterium endosymbiont of Geopemphigus sp. TaxID=2047937 RepID=UPI000CCFE8AA|nr:type II CAAX endopeptidase family protein [Bacteroidetes bacterium endosymbiont of Geopemphigus sp.]